MFNSIKSSFTRLNLYFSYHIYIKIRENLVIVKCIETSKLLEDKPTIAIDKTDGRIIAIGNKAFAFKNKTNVIIRNGFSHPRTIVADFIASEKILQYMIHKLYDDHSWFPHPSPIMIIHPLEKITGNLTWAESRALYEMAAGAGAASAIVWTGRELTDDEIISENYPYQEGKVYDNKPFALKIRSDV